jgi:hypothetical protein
MEFIETKRNEIETKQGKFRFFSVNFVSIYFVSFRFVSFRALWFFSWKIHNPYIWSIRYYCGFKQPFNQSYIFPL